MKSKRLAGLVVLAAGLVCLSKPVPAEAVIPPPGLFLSETFDRDSLVSHLEWFPGFAEWQLEIVVEFWGLRNQEYYFFLKAAADTNTADWNAITGGMPLTLSTDGDGYCQVNVVSYWPYMPSWCDDGYQWQLTARRDDASGREVDELVTYTQRPDR